MEFAGGEERGGTFDVVAADAQTVVVANGGYLGRTDDHPFGPTTFYVLDANSGVERTRFDTADPSFTSSDFAMADGVLVYAEGRSVVARDLSGGAVRWQRDFAEPAPRPGGVSGPPSVTLQRSADSRTLFARSVGDNEVFVLAGASGKQLWTLPFETFVRASADGITVVSGSYRRHLRGLDTQTGRARWRYSVPVSVASGSLATEINVQPARGRFVFSTVCDQG